MSKRTLIAGTIVATAAALTLSACSSSGSSPSHSTMSGGATSMSGGAMSSGMSMSGAASATATVQAGAPATGPHNAADVAFATDMIPHHAQALAMARTALSRATNPTVKQLAQMIENEQTPEISAMSGWLKGWNEPVPSTSTGSMNMGGMSMPGMMSDADMTKLDSATGATFDKLFLTQMITHHTGALTMANTELSSGQNTDAKTLARSIIAGQSKEITEMKALLPTIK